MPTLSGTLTSASPPGVDEGWFTPTGPFKVWRDGGPGTLQLMVRGHDETGPGVATGDVLTELGAQPGEENRRGIVSYRLVLASGTGPIAWKAWV